MHNPMGNDDATVGRVLGRRDALLLLGGASAYGLLWLTGCSRGSDSATVGNRGGSAGGDTSLDCAAKPELTQGPYYVDEKLTRADIRSDSRTGALQAGVPLTLAFKVSRIQSSACTPLSGAVVDVWHCNALGVYSDANDPGFNTKGQNWLRGNLTTDQNGEAVFRTIFPGWYQGRATHIHFKVRSAAGANATHEFTSQLFFAENFLSSIYTSRAPYSTKGDTGRLSNARDGIYSQGGSQLLLSPTASGDGYSATFNLGIYTDS